MSIADRGPFCIFLVLGLAGAAQAGSILVESSLDDTLPNLAGNGTCDLREAVAAANTDAAVGECGGGIHSSITFDSSLTDATITLADGELAVTDDLDLLGPALRADGLILDGAGASRIFAVTGGATLAISAMTLTNGNTSGTGGAVNSDGPLDFDTCTIDGNTAGGNGGGLATTADISLGICTVSGNTSTGGDGGGLYAGTGITLNRVTVSGNRSENSGNGGGVAANPLSITNSTFSGNVASGFPAAGGAIYINSQPNDAFISSSTIVDNIADGSGGGIAGRFDINRGSSANLRLINTIVADNVATDDNDITVAGNAPGFFTLDADNSMLGVDTAALVSSGSNNLFTDAPLLEPLGDYGGPTATHRPIPGLFGDPGVAVDRGTDAFGLPVTDQRGPGFPRVVDGIGLGTAVVDIGAVEFSPPPVGNLRVVKNVEGAPAPEDWRFTLASDTAGCDISGLQPGNPADTGSGGDSELTWTDVPSASDSGTPCTYTITETTQAGYSLTESICRLEGGGTTGVNRPPASVTGIEVPDQTMTTCTFTNGENPSVEVSKIVSGATEGYVPGTEFELELDCLRDQFDTTFMLADGETFSVELLPPTDCEVSETAVPAPVPALPHTAWSWNVVPGSPVIDPASFSASAGDSISVSVENELTRTSIAAFDPAPSGLACDGDTATAAFTIRVDNAGTEILENLQVTDDLAATFGTVPFAVVGVSSADFTISPGFDGRTDTALLTGTDTLPSGGIGTIELTVDLSLEPGASESFSNQPVAAGTGAVSGQAVSDAASGSVTPGDPSDDTAATFTVDCSAAPAIPVPVLDPYGLLALLAGVAGSAFLLLTGTTLSRRNRQR